MPNTDERRAYKLLQKKYPQMEHSLFAKTFTDAYWKEFLKFGPHCKTPEMILMEFEAFCKQKEKVKP